MGIFGKYLKSKTGFILRVHMTADVKFLYQEIPKYNIEDIHVLVKMLLKVKDNDKENN